MIQSFSNKGTADIWNGVKSKGARRTCPEVLWKGARKKLGMINAAIRLDDLRFPPRNQLEALRDDRKGQHAIRINDQYRVCFEWTDSGAEQVEVTDYH